MKKLSLFAMFIAFAQPALAEDLSVASKDRKDLRLAVYHGDTALVTDTRGVALAAGKQTITFADVSRKIQAESAFLQSSSGSVTVLEQTMLSGILSPAAMLKHFIGQKVTAVRINPATGAEIREDAILLSSSGGTVLRIADRIETQFPGRIVFPSLPAHLLGESALSFSLAAETASKQSLALSYLTTGIGWQADYVVQLAPANDRLALTGLATVTNQSGTSFPAAKLQLIAGQVNRAQPDRPMPMQRKTMSMAMESAPTADYPPQASPQGLADYYAFTVESPVTLIDGETKQIGFLNAADIKTRKKYVLASGDLMQPYQEFGDDRKFNPVATLVFQNSKEANLGKPIPAGTVRVYQKDKQGNNYFIGEAAMEPTPNNGEVKIAMGEAFDITALKRQLAFDRLPRRANDNRPGETVEREFLIELQNAKDEKTTVEVREEIAGDWEMLSSSLPHKRESAHVAVWNIDVPANGKASLKYRVRIRYY